MWLYDACIPLNAVNSSFYQTTISKILVESIPSNACTGHGCIGPTVMH